MYIVMRIVYVCYFSVCSLLYMVVGRDVFLICGIFMYVCLSMVLVYNEEMVERIVFLSKWNIQSLSFVEVEGTFYLIKFGGFYKCGVR